MTQSGLYRHVIMSAILSSLVHVHGFKLTQFPTGTNALETDASARKTIVFKEKLPEAIETESGRKVVLECEAGGSPVPTIHWLYQGSRISQGRAHSVLDDEAYFEQTTHNLDMARLQLGNTRGRLVIDCVTPQGTGEYTCVAQTPTERIVSKTYLQVLGELVDCPRIEEGGLPPHIYMWENQRLEFEGADVQLYCRASGYPLPELTWYDRNGNAIVHQDPQYKLLKNGDLLVKNIDWMSHMGMFRCHVSNRFGEEETTVFLYPTQP